jgi:uncharacterized protein (TIGR02246 family)
MKKTLILISGTLVASVVGYQALNAAEMSAAEKAIRQAADAFADAYNRGNADAIAARWTPDGEYTIGNATVKGRKDIARTYGEFLRANPGSKMKVKIDSVRVLAPTVAIEQGTASVEGSSNGPPSSSAYTAVHVKQGDEWLMASVRESDIPTSAGEELTDLGWLVGTWMASGDKAKVEMTFAWIADKHFLRGETTITSNGKSSPGGMQIIGKDAQSGRIVSWFFNADGGHGYGAWSKAGKRWLINTVGTTATGVPTSSVNVLYRADENIASWRSVNRKAGNMPLPDATEVVIERAGSNTSAKK